MEFRLLGGVDAWCDGRRVDVGHARQRCVLAALLVDANRPVTVEQLAGRVWGQNPPQRAHRALYSYLSRLRQALRPCPGVRIERERGGYVLAVDESAVDLHRFRSLVTQARAGGDGSDDARRLALLEQALELWRGEAFAGLDTAWISGVRVALNHERLAAELDRNDLALRAGGHTALVTILAERVAAHPLDERLASQYIRALYLNGRQAEALLHYEQLRVRLAEELGTDPSPPLRDLHRQILTADQRPTDPPDTAAGPGPAQLPGDVLGFTGRQAALARLDTISTAAADQPTAIVITAIAGTAGVGKTALAVHWAHRVRSRFPDGQLYVNLHGFDPTCTPMSPAEAVRGFLDAFAVPAERIPADPQQQINLYRSLLADRRVLVVLDNARDAEQVRPLLPGAAGCLVLVTSRNQLAGLVSGEGAHPLTLDVLSVADARSLLAARLGGRRIAAEPQATDEIITRCARLPLALAIAAARAATHPNFALSALADELRAAHGDLDVFDSGDPGTSVRTVFSWSYRTLSQPAARLFRLLGLHPGADIAAPAAASICGTPPGKTRPLLAELARAHLVTERVPGRYTFHDLLRAYATERTHAEDADEDRHAAVHRLLDHYLHTAYTAALLLNPHRHPITPAPAEPGVTPEPLADSGDALAWFMAEHGVLMAAIERASGAGFDTHASQLPWTVATFLDRQGHWHDSLAAQRAALDATRRLVDRPGQAEAHRMLVHAYARLHRYDDARAHGRHALRLYDELGDHTGQGRAHLVLGSMSGLQGRHQDAVDHGHRALELFQDSADRPGQAGALNNVGWHSAQLGHYREALVYCQQALDLYQELGDRPGQANTWDSLGFAYHHLGRHGQAAICYQHSLDLIRQVGGRFLEAETLIHLGDTQHAAGNRDAARDAWQQALHILRDLDHPDAERISDKLRDLRAAASPA